MAWKLVESVVKEPGLVWRHKMPHTINGIEGLFFVGDSTISYGIGKILQRIVHYCAIPK